LRILAASPGYDALFSPPGRRVSAGKFSAANYWFPRLIVKINRAALQRKTANSACKLRAVLPA